MFVPRSVDRLRPNKDRQTCQAPRADSTPEPAEARPLPSRIPSSPGDPRAPGPSNDGATDHAPARRVRPPGAASGRLPATNGGTEDLLPVLSLARSRSPVSRLTGAPSPILAAFINEGADPRQVCVDSPFVFASRRARLVRDYDAF